MGHALNKILKDVVVKSGQMMGYDTPYVPGWDCHGLPIEWKIEEKYREAGLDKDAVDILTFREECRTFAQKWVDIQSAQFQRLGVSGDWSNPYLTMRYRAEGKISREIHKFASNGLLYKGAKPVMWSVVEKTALAEAEVEYQEHKSITIWVRFPIVKAANTLLEGADIVIWTTTPWTIPSNRAVAFGKDIEYGVYQYEGGKLVLATSLADGVKEAAKIESWELLGTLTGADFAGAVCAHPLRGILKSSSLRTQGSSEEGAQTDWIPACAGMTEEGEGIYEFDVPALEGDFVTDEAGTGFVHIAPGHGEDDFNLVKKYNDLHLHGRPFDRGGWVDETVQSIGFEIEITDNVTDDGKFRPHVPLFAGMEVYTQKGELGGGNFAVLKELTEAGKLLAKGSLRHEYPHSWRSKAPLIFRTTPQWFIAMNWPFSSLPDSFGQSMDYPDKPGNDGTTLRQCSLQAIADTNWVPAKGERRISAMIENRPDWCISRQRAWGVPIALFVHKDTGEVMRDAAVFERIDAAFEEEGADCWWQDGAKARFLGAEYNADEWDQIFDIVDVWFESGSTHAFVVGDTQTWPDFKGAEQIDLYLEGSDQHRGWFHSSLLESCGTTGKAPYKNVLTHGFVLDDKGYKMSKSLGNVVDPLEMMETHGADILRLWVMLSDTAEDIRIGADTLKNTGDLYRRIRNTLRFLLGALDGFTKDERVDFFERPETLPELEQLMLHRLFEVDAAVRGHIERFEFTKIAKFLHDFCNEDLSAFYFDIRKDSLYCDAPDSDKRRACRSVMAVIFNGLTAWLAPILSFTAEEAWSYRPGGVFEDADSVHLRDFPNVPAAWQNALLAAKWESVKALRKRVFEAIEPLRASKELGSSLEAAPRIYVSAEEAEALQGLDMAEICITSQAAVEIGALSRVDVEKAKGGKCVRCWQVLPEVTAAQSVCNRCESAVRVAKAQAA
jgi:isoleucyl-tRNA synthetase